MRSSSSADDARGRLAAIVEAHGGRIWVDPNPEGGVIFRLTLKIIEVGELSHGQ